MQMPVQVLKTRKPEPMSDEEFAKLKKEVDSLKEEVARLTEELRGFKK